MEVEDSEQPEGQPEALAIHISIGEPDEEGMSAVEMAYVDDETVPLDVLIDALNTLVEQIKEEREYEPTIH